MTWTWHAPVDADALRTLPTSESALLLLRHLATGTGGLHLNAALDNARKAYGQSGESDVEGLVIRLADAWTWLEARGFIGQDPGQSVGSGYQRMTSDGRQVAATDQAARMLAAADRIMLKLHSTLEAKVRPIFMLGDFETAAFAAMKEVEVRVRSLAKAPESSIGVKLMQRAFAPEGGPLTDADADGGERVAILNLFVGAIGTFKNPASHRTVAYDDATEASEVVLLADLLMRLLDRVEARLDDVPSGPGADQTAGEPA
jgi:uncharacterized protein (TIGR02391 family)